MPINIIDALQLVARNYLGTEGDRHNKFVVTDRRSLPLNPEGIITSEATLSAD